MASSDTQVYTVEARPRSSSVSTGAVVLVVIVLTTAAALLRLYRLGDWSFWVDEMFTIRDSVGTGWRYHGGTYPLSYMLIAAVLKPFGVNEWNARIVPALFGIATPALIYLMARRSFGDLTAALAAAIVVVSPWHLYWSQMARFYTMTLFFSTASVLALHRGLEEDNRWHVAAGDILLALATLSHYSALLLLPGMALYVLLLRLFKWPRPPGLSLRNVLVFLAPFILGGVAVGMKGGSLIAKYLGGHPTGTSIADPVRGGIYIIASLGYRLELTIAMLALVTVGIGIARKDRGALLLGSTAFAAVCVLTVLGTMSHAENRYGFVILGPAVVLASVTLAVISRRVWESSHILALIVPLVVMLPMMQHDACYFRQASNGERWDYRAATDYVRGHAKPGETVYSAMSLPVIYYLRDSGLTVRDLGPDGIVRPPEGRVWFIIEDSTRGQSATRSLNGWLKTNCKLAAHFSAGSPAADYGLSVYSYER